MIRKIPRYLLTFYSTSGAMAVEKYCKQNGIAGRLLPVPREISASCGLAWAVPLEQKGELAAVEAEFADEIEGKWSLESVSYTHLDVYKRQVLHLVILLEELCCPPFREQQ